MSWELSGWELGFVCGLALLTGGSLAALAARQLRPNPQAVPSHSSTPASRPGSSAKHGVGSDTESSDA